MFDPRKLQQAMRQMGIKQESIEADEVIIKSKAGTIVIKQPEVVKISVKGSSFYQISGVEEQIPFTEEDVKMVIEKTGVERERAVEALKKTKGDIAEAIMLIMGE